MGRARLRTAFVFLGPYMPELESVVAGYPGATIEEGHRGDELTFRTYHLPR